MCYDDQARPPQPPGMPGAVQSADIELTANDGNRFMVFRALPQASPSAQVVILPDIRGLHQFYKELALRFAEVGIAASAMDYFGRTAGIGSRDESFVFMPHVEQLTLEAVKADAAATLADLREHAGQQASFTLGFCMGGTLSFMLGAEALDLTGVIGFYAGMTRSFGGSGTLLERAPAIRRPALGLFGGADQGIPVEKVEAFEQILAQAGVEHQIHIYPGAPHSFFDRRQAEYAEASADAWERVLGFIKSR